MYDCIIVGKGPAGISTALYAIRGGLSVLVIANGSGSLSKADKIENYYGFSSPIKGSVLLDNGIEQSKSLGVKFASEEVVDIVLDDTFKVVTTAQEYDAKTVVIATGSVRNKPKIKNLVSLEGKGVSYCAVCDGFFYRKKIIAVFGNSNYALSELTHLLPLASKCYLLTNALPCEISVPNNVEVVEKKIVSFDGENKLESVTFEDGSSISLDGLFVAIGQAQSDSFARKLGIETAGNNIVVNDAKMTNIDGLFAVGDCIGGLLQIAKAVSDGATAGTEIIKFVKKKTKIEVND